MSSSKTDLRKGREKYYCGCYHKDLKGRRQQNSNTPKRMLQRDCHHKGFSCKYCLCSSRNRRCLVFVLQIEFKNPTIKYQPVRLYRYTHKHAHKSFINWECFQLLMLYLELTLQFLSELPQSSNHLCSACISTHLE